MNVDVIVPPPVEPITLAEVYLHLRLTPFDSPPVHPDDALLTTFIKAARIDAENQTRRSFVYQTLRATGPLFSTREVLTRSCWGGASAYGVGLAALALPRGPVLEVLSVSYWDGDNAEQTILAGDYYLGTRGELSFVSAFAAPSLYARSDAVRIEYRAGFDPIGSPPDDFVSNVPADIKAALLLGVQLLYDELTPEKRRALEMARDSLLSAYHLFTIA